MVRLQREPEDGCCSGAPAGGAFSSTGAITVELESCAIPLTERANRSARKETRIWFRIIKGTSHSKRLDAVHPA